MNGRQSDDGPKVHEDCLPCEAFLGEPEPGACTRFKDYITPEEEQVLSMLRDLKEQVRFLRGKIRGMEYAIRLAPESNPGKASTGRERDKGVGGPDPLQEEMAACVQQLEELRATWKEWEVRREEARNRKMALLGHGPWKGNGG